MQQSLHTKGPARKAFQNLHGIDQHLTIVYLILNTTNAAKNLTGQKESGIALCFFLGILNILEEDLCTAVRSVANFKILVSFEYSFKASIGTVLNHVTSVNMI